MIEVKNKLRSPVQLLVRSRTGPSAFTTLILPGIGAGKNVRVCPDEWFTGEAGVVLERVEKTGHISTRYLSNRVEKGA